MDFFPTKIEIAISKNGNDFKTIKKMTYEIDISPAHETKEFSTTLNGEEIRFIKVKATNLSVCPQWHPGAGGKAWVFVDEIVVK